MIQPPRLKNNDAVTIVSPAGQIAPQLIDAASQALQRWGLRVKVGTHAAAGYAGFAGADAQRCADLQAAINDADTSAILCTRGGYGCGRIVEAVDFSPLLQRPKWLIGFSDITVLHARLQRMWLQSIHGAMVKSFSEGGDADQSVESLRQALFGELTGYDIAPHALNIRGTANGIVRGGNLSLLANVAATPDDIDTARVILFLEDAGEYVYHIDRMMNNLQRSGKLNKLAGVVVGRFSHMKEAAILSGKTAYEIIADYVSPLNIPVCFGFPAGHEEPNAALYLGREIVLKVNQKGALISYL